MKSLLVAHDAGGAEILCAWLSSCVQQSGFGTALPSSVGDWGVVATGPAARIFQRESIPVLSVEAVNITDYERIITGTSYGATLENEFIERAKNREVKCVSVLDHWLHYPERFFNCGYQMLPDELWACDSSAFCLAENFFPEVSVILQPNWYWEKIRGQVTPGCSGHYLIALENRQIRGQTWRDNVDAALHWLSLQKHVLHVTIRAHPTMEQSEIERYLANKGQLPFNASASHGNLIEDLSSCFCVVGYQTTVLALARVCGKRAVSLVNIDEQLVIPLAGIEQPFK